MKIWSSNLLVWNYWIWTVDRGAMAKNRVGVIVPFFGVAVPGLQPWKSKDSPGARILHMQPFVKKLSTNPTLKLEIQITFKSFFWFLIFNHNFLI